MYTNVDDITNNLTLFNGNMTHQLELVGIGTNNIYSRV